MSFTYNAWMPARQKHELTELAKEARAKANGKTYAPRPYVHVKGKIIATVDSAALAALKRAAGIAEPQLVQDTSTWSMAAPGEWARDATPAQTPRPPVSSEIAEGLREIERCKRSMRLAAEHDARVDAERVDVPYLQVAHDEPTPVEAPPTLDGRRLGDPDYLRPPHRLPKPQRPPPSPPKSRSVAGRPRVDCVPCGKRHYARARPCGLTG